MLHKNMARTCFNEMLSELPKLKRGSRAPKVDGLLAEFYHENSSFGSTAAKTFTSRHMSTKSKSSCGGPFNVPHYFFTPDDNLFNSMRQNKEEPLEPKAFVLTSPDNRIRKNLFEGRTVNMHDSLYSTNAPREGANFEQHTNGHACFVPAKDADYKMQLGQKVCADETERVKKHEAIRLRQLEIEEEVRVRQLIKDKQEAVREKAFEKMKREEAKDRKTEFTKLDDTRHHHYTTTQKKYKTLDNDAHRAGLSHHK